MAKTLGDFFSAFSNPNQGQAFSGDPRTVDENTAQTVRQFLSAPRPTIVSISDVVKALPMPADFPGGAPYPKPAAVVLNMWDRASGSLQGNKFMLWRRGKSTTPVSG